MAEPEVEEEALNSPAHFLAGALAGTAEHTGMFPVDTIKVRSERVFEFGARDMVGHVLCECLLTRLYFCAFNVPRSRSSCEESEFVVSILYFGGSFFACCSWAYFLLE